MTVQYQKENFYWRIIHLDPKIPPDPRVYRDALSLPQENVSLPSDGENTVASPFHSLINV